MLTEKNPKNELLFQIERELVLSIDKGLTKVPLMHEPRGNPGNRITNGIQLLPKQTGSIAPDHPPKHTQAWVSLKLKFIIVSCITDIWKERCIHLSL